MSEQLLSARELGEHLGLSAATVLDRWERGDLPGYRLFGRKGGPVRFRLSEIEALLASWREAPSTPALLTDARAVRTLPVQVGDNTGIEEE